MPQLLFCLLSLIFLCSSVSGEAIIKEVVEPVIHGEGPHWDTESQALYYVDIKNQTVNKYVPKTGVHTQAHIDGGAVTLIVTDKFNQNQFIVSRGLDIVSIKWDGQSPKPSSLKVLATVEQDKPENRFNDGKVDASGRLWAGTMGPESLHARTRQGALYSFDWPNDFKPVTRLTPVSLSNGLAWNSNDTLMYYVDSPTRVVSVFDFNIVTGELSNRRVLFDLAKNDITGLPDGMTIDENDNIWVAVYGGSTVLHIDTKTGKLLSKIDFPVTQVTSCAFGGEDLRDLYVTTSRNKLTEEQLKEQPLAGALFLVTGLGVRGQIKPNSILIP